MASRTQSIPHLRRPIPPASPPGLVYIPGMLTRTLALGCVLALTSAVPAQTSFSLALFAPERREPQRGYERDLNLVVSPDSLGKWHDLVASEPHIAGREGDLRQIERLHRAFQDMGLETEIHWIWPYLSNPVEASVRIVEPEPVTLPIMEPSVERDPYSTHPELTFGFNAYSGSGDTTAEVVYANFGKKEDFERLAKLGIDVRGKIVLARYGGNFRGFKAKFAEQAGAAGVIIYTDPAQSGYMRGLMYPEGGWATPYQIERGSLATLDATGDPLTPGVEAAESADRLDPAAVDLPRIPVQPVGWAAAEQIMSRMTGEPVPEESWQGAMPLAYRVTGGPNLRIRLVVKQDRRITKTANITATLRGTKFPDETVILGCHHDAWGFGASDPTAGLIVLMEAARSFADLAKRGVLPERTIVFAAWGAEEHGIIGSSEWVEGHRAALVKDAVCYMNLDMAAMGPLFGASGSPTLAQVIIDAAREVPAARRTDITAFDEWLTRTRATAPDDTAVEPEVRSMGGGSDHVGFYFHASVPCMSVGGSGGRGTAYHSNYDTLTWYRLVVGEDYEPARMVTAVVNVVTARMARADIVPIEPAGIPPATRRHLSALEKRAKERGIALDTAPARAACDELELAAASFDQRLRAGVESGSFDDAKTQALSRLLIGLERRWMREAGLTARPWLKNTYMAPDEDSGYSSWPLPEARRGVERDDGPAAAAGLADLARRLRDIAAALADAGG